MGCLNNVCRVCFLWCCRASTAATRCQTHLETVVESNTEGLKERIAAAEAAVEEAERSAAEAVHLQNEVVKAASMTEGHSDVASSQSAIAERVGLQRCTSTSSLPAAAALLFYTQHSVDSTYGICQQ